MKAGESGRERVLLVEDDRETRALIESCLQEDGFEVVSVERGSSATAAVRSNPFSMVVLDLRLPDTDGVSLCRNWRRSGVGLPILILTARTDVSSRVEGLNAGADDYLGKPFALAELRARLNALLRRRDLAGSRRIFSYGDLTVDLSRRIVRRAAHEIPLTRREFDILERLVGALGHAISRDDLLEGIWGESSPRAASSLEVIIGRLRRKLDAPGSERLIRTLRGYGYSFAVDADPEDE